MTPEQRATIDAVVAVLETGRVPGPEAYETCTILPDGAGITYGVHQATGDVLQAILDEYAARAGAYSGEIRRVLGGRSLADAQVYRHELEAATWVRELCGVLRDAGRDTTMQAAQRHVFEVQFWRPAETYGLRLQLVHPLSYLALYDTAIQSGADLRRVDLLRKLFPEVPPSRGGDERDWTLALVRARWAWLRTFSSPIVARQEAVRRSAYRAAELEALCLRGRWDLALPLTIRGQRIG